MSALEQVALDMQPPEVIVRLMLTFDRAADDHLDDCARRQWSPRTLATYRRTYDLLSQRLPRDQDVSKVTTDDLRRFLGTNTHLAPGTLSGFESHLRSLFRQLYLDGKIAKDPTDRLIRTKRRRPEDLEVVTVDADEVRRILAAGHTWTEKLAPAVPAYLGPRRHAVASLRLRDYDRTGQRMRFREKGGKIIWKPVPLELAHLIAAAETDGAYGRYDYIVPPEGVLWRKGDRDDRVIWRVIRRLADRAGVDCHVHALRAAFACFYDESFPGDVLALRDLMGHASVKTTELYLRRRDKEAGMQRVRALSWARTEPVEGGVEGDVPQDRGSDAAVQTPVENGATGQEVGLAATGSVNPSSGWVTPADRDELRETIAGRDGWACFYCGEFADEIHVEHTVPRSHGGSDDVGNLVLACGLCNRGKALLPAWFFTLTRRAGLHELPSVDRAREASRLRSLWRQPQAPSASANSGENVGILFSMGAGGFEPPSEDNPHQLTAGRIPELDEALNAEAKAKADGGAVRT